MKSLKNQLSQIFSHLTYISYGLNLPPTIQYLSKSPIKHVTQLKYKIHSANHIYQQYKQDGFQYSQKGITPKQIAQEMLIHLDHFDDLHVQIDQFGFFIVSPQQIYFDRFKTQLINTSKLQYLEMKALNYLCKKRQSLAQNNQIKSIQLIYGLQYQEKLSLSHLRVIFYMNAVYRKMILMKEIQKDHIFKALYNNSQARFDQQLRTFQIQNTFTSITQEKQNIQTLLGCFRHRKIHFQKYFRPKEIILFSQIYPDLTLDEILKNCENKQDFKNLMKRLEKQLWLYSTKHPYQLKNNNNLKYNFDLNNNLRFLEQIILLCDFLNDNKLIEAYNLYICLEQVVKSEENKRIIKGIGNSMKQIFTEEQLCD